MNPVTKMKVLGKSGEWEIGILVIGLCYLQHRSELFTESSPYEAMRKITDEKDRQEIAKQLKGDT